MWRSGRVTVRIGKPMDFARFDGLAGNRFIERAVIDEVIYELMQLSGQEYVDIYAGQPQRGCKAGFGFCCGPAAGPGPADGGGLTPGRAAVRPAIKMTATAHHT